MKVKAIITGSTGMVGKGVLLECLSHPDVESVLILNRREVGISHPKLKEIILDDFMKTDEIEKELQGYNACFHCMGISSASVSAEVYEKVTYDISMRLASLLYTLNRDMVFVYVSGTGTSTGENSRMRWANVKGKTENDILKLGFKRAYMFRPGFIKPEKGIRSATRLYRILYLIINPLFPLLKRLFPDHVTTTTRVGKAMINLVLEKPDTIYFENREINQHSME